MLKIRYVSIFCCLCLMLCTAAAAGEERGPQEAKKSLDRALQKQIDIQKQVRSWSQEKRSLVSEILSLKVQLDWYGYQNEKYEAYIQRRRQAIVELRRSKQEMKTLRMQLEPYLEQVIADLESFIAEDMTFLSRERQERIASLKRAMNDYHLSMSEKLRRVLEGLQVEARYGQSTGVTTRSLEIEGQTMQVQVLRLGRVARFYRSLDGEYVGRWSRQSESWEPLSQEWSRSLKKAADMVEQEQAVDLVDLPIGGPEG